MNSRERVLTALAHQAPDRVPRLLYEEVIGYTPPIERLLQAYCAPQSPRDYFGMDITRVTMAPSRLPLRRFEGWLETHREQALASGQVDEWGVWWRTGNFHHFARVESPLRGIQDLGRLQKYPWPDVDQPYRFQEVPAQVAALHALGLAVAAYAGSVFEQAWYLRSMEDLMIDMLTAPAVAHYLFERAAACQRFAAVQFAQAGVDILITGDDVAAQHSLLLSLDTWREFLKPRLAATVRAAKQAKPDLAVFYHSDGNVTELVPELIDVGIDILNPLQPECVDPADLKRRYGDRLSFWGAVSVQRTMPSGTAEEVRKEVRTRIQQLGRNGGYILAPAHVLGPEVPWENIVAFFEAANQDVPVSGL